MERVGAGGRPSPGRVVRASASWVRGRCVGFTPGAVNLRAAITDCREQAHSPERIVMLSRTRDLQGRALRGHLSLRAVVQRSCPVYRVTF